MTGKNRLGGLGRGLGALIPTAPPTDPAAEVSAGAVVPGPASPEPAAAMESAASRGGSDERPPTGSHPAGPAPTGPAPTGPTSTGSNTAESGASAPTPDLWSETGPLPVSGAYFADLELSRISRNPKQPRQVFDEDALTELAHSVREFGVLQPVVVRPHEGGYELIMGERRLRAAEAAGLTTIPAIVRETADDAMLRDALLENIHRTALNPLEEAAAYQQLLDEFGATHEELATRIGRSRPQISNTIRLLNLPVPVQRRVAAGVLSSGHARALLGLEEPGRQEDLAVRIVAEGLS
ncbi:MAG: ParB/RepB/Spo0J family partition protein, partial [Actinobacteria bacterium]|nr:ParB/RepB/Spo0J family partition protein [Actinomycetota bacterium]